MKKGVAAKGTIYIFDYHGIRAPPFRPDLDPESSLYFSQSINAGRTDCGLLVHLACRNKTLFSQTEVSSCLKDTIEDEFLKTAVEGNLALFCYTILLFKILL